MATASLDTAGAGDAPGIERAAIEKRPDFAPAALPGRPPSLAGLTRAQLKAALVGAGVPERESRMRAGQVWHWVNFRGATDFGQMTNVGKALKADLAHTISLLA